ncbi:hypothetical protein [Amphritea pacifica]|uniref:Uncharacterized protein n=1 Tax=Amphritea pacifica TaxID=2811233 RepID=A0ABS2W8U9_9GAMM|nr:hypothetical protein [Amphritea pacifica]MBN0988003.1 hypothetical protein [Amphritea pacifica]
MNLDSEKLDKLINKQYVDLVKTSELHQLSKLFNPSFIKELLELIRPELANRKSYKQSLDIIFCWIDKRPLADFSKQRVKDHNNNIITKKVEIADAAFYFFNENGHYQNGQEQITHGSSLSLLFQAKRSTSVKAPVVPVGKSKAKNNSTAKELALLSSWPKFDLYKTSGNKSPIYVDMEIAYPNGEVPPFAWFGVCPPTKDEAWKSRWMCGPSKLGSMCEHTLGQVLTALLTRSTLGIDRVHSGEEFNFDPTWASGQKLNGESSWDILNNEILFQCKESHLPKSIFTTETKRCVTAKEIIHLDKGFRFALFKTRNYLQYSCGGYNTKIAEYMSENTVPNSFYETALHDGAMPVVIFSIKSMEG